jgi:hypothetical protein
MPAAKKLRDSSSDCGLCIPPDLSNHHAYPVCEKSVLFLVITTDDGRRGDVIPFRTNNELSPSVPVDNHTARLKKQRMLPN